MPSVFDIVGPIMVGPSSSHTVGALRLARVASKIKGSFDSLTIILYGSFADSGAGHGTDRAIIAGLLGMDIKDIRIKNSFDYAKDKNWSYKFERAASDVGKHPNTVRFVFSDKNKDFYIEGESVGGGEIKITEINGVRLCASFKQPTLVTKQNDEPGSMAKVLNILAKEKINVSAITSWREARNTDAIAIIELDQSLSEKVANEIEQLENVQWARHVDDLWRAVA